MTHTTSDPTSAFDRHAGDYNAARRRLIPPFDAFYATAVAALGLAAGPPRRILDLGAGTGLLASFVRAAYPDAALTLLDGSVRMLEQARHALGPENVTYLQGDLGDPLPDGRWDGVVSALAIHHLSDRDKRTLLARVHDALSPGGVFVNAEQVTGSSPLFADLYERWHERRARQAGSDDAEWAGAVQRMSHDRCATVEDQLMWLRSAGFADADCLFKDHRFAVLAARRGP